MSSNSDLESILVISDTHRPYHDKHAWRLMLKVARDLKPHRLVIIGDFADFFAVSSHSKDPHRKLELPIELADVNAGLDELDALGAEDKIFVEGNHCDRLRRYIQDRAQEFDGVVSVPDLLRLKARGWRYVPYKRHTRVGKLYLTHDVGSAGRNAVFRCLDTYQHSVVTGHTHRLAYIVEGNAVGEYKLSAQFGWLGDVEQIDYMSEAKARKDWALGFGWGYIHKKTGIAYLQPVPIVRYTACVNGRLYAA